MKATKKQLAETQTTDSVFLSYLITDVDLMKDDAILAFFWRKSHNLGYSVNGDVARIREVVYDDCIVTLFEQQNQCVTSNVATSSSNENGRARLRSHAFVER